MGKKPKNKPESSEVTKTMIPELHTSSVVNALGFKDKVFSKSDPTIHFEVENTSPPKEKAPPQARKPDTARVMIEKDPMPAAPPPARTRSLLGRGHLTDPVEIAPRGQQPLWPIMLSLAVVAGGYYWYEYRPKLFKRHPASVASGPDTPGPGPADQPTAKELDTRNLMTPIITNFQNEDSGIFLLKSDTDDFRVLVNGKDVPVISGRIQVPLHQQLDLRFVRRGFKEIQMTATFKSPETRALNLKFQRSPETKPE